MKENEYGFKCEHNEVDQFIPYVESDGEFKNSRVSKENLYRFLGLREVKPTPIPTPVPVPSTPEDLELNAVISDMGTDVHRERVSFETEEELREKYKNLARYNIPKRAYLFLSR